jgi:putative cell wall-binding protein
MLRTYRRAAIAALAALVVSTGLALGPGSIAGAGATQAAPLGVYKGAANPNGVQAFAAWTSSPITYALDFLASDSWSSIESPGWWAQAWSSSPFTTVYSVPMLPSGSTYTIQQGASGAYDSHFVTLAQRLVAGNQASAVIRPGWEFNGNWFNWSAISDPASFAAYWRHIVTAMRSVAGSRFTFDWSPSLGDRNMVVENAYPGDAYVDYIGLDAYDQGWMANYQDPAVRWNGLLNAPYGLNWQKSFAAAHGKQMTYPEWGLTIRPDGHGGGDDPYYIQQMHDWIISNDVAYALYFEFDAPDGQHAMMTGRFPQAAALFQRLFNSTGTAPTPTTISPTISPTTSTVVPPTATPAATKVLERKGGGDRYDTAAQLSRNGYPSGASAVFVASGTSFADALSVGPAAASIGAPVLLSAQDTLPGSTSTELRRLRPTAIYVLGGTARISDRVARELGAVAPVTRIAGTDRYATSAAISARFFRSGASTVYLATGAGFADSLAAGAAAAYHDGPILLVQPDGVPAAIAQEVRRLGTQRAVILGGTAAIGLRTEATVRQLVGSVKRLSGGDRYATAALVSNESPRSDTIYVVRGDNFPDALAAVPSAVQDSATQVLLVQRDAIPSATMSELRRLAPDKIVVVGGVSAVSSGVVNQLTQVLNQPS